MSIKQKIQWASPEIGEEETQAVAEAVKSTWIGGNGPRVAEFEKVLARTTGAKYALAVSNGTAALLCAMQGLREQGIMMKFAIPTMTFFATGSTAYEMQRGMPKLLDCEADTWNINPTEKELNGIPILMPVDVGGLPCDYDELKRTRKLILADSAESMGSKYRGEPIGTQAKVHCFSFHSAKVVTTGEGGAIVTNDGELYEIMKSICNQGYGKKEWYEYKHDKLGFNYRMSELHAALGLVQFKKLDRYVTERNEKAQVYKDILEDSVGYQIVPKNCTNNYFLFSILVKDPTAVCINLAKENIGCKRMWIPLHQQAPLKQKKTFENAEFVGNHGVMLPIHNNINQEDVKEIATIVKKVVKKLDPGN